MTSHDEPSTRQDSPSPAPRSAKARYLFALVAATAGLLVTIGFFESDVSPQPIYAPLLVAAALTTWYGGPGPAALVVAVCWGASLLILVEPDGAMRFSDTEGITHWLVNLAAAVLIAVVGSVMRVRAQRIAFEAQSARTAVRELESLRQLSVALGGALSSADVADVVSGHAPALISSTGATLCLVEGQQLTIVGPSGLAAEARPDGSHLTLESRTLLAEAVRTGSLTTALDRGELEARYPDSAAALPLRVERALAAPLRAERAVIGSIGFYFDSESHVDDDTQALAGIVADLAGQAFERSRLYEEEQQQRRRAERLQRMTALLSNALTPADVADVVADEVGAAVDADVVVVAAVNDGEVTSTLALRGDDEAARTLFDELTHADAPGGRAARERRSSLIDSKDDLPVLVVPLVAGRRTNGLLIAAWSEPRRIADDDRALVEALAGQAAQTLDRASRFESEHAIAETLQRSVLPTSLPRVAGVQLAGRYLPGSAQLDVGGDWFDALLLPDRKLALVVGDVVGKGVHAAASMGQLRNAIRAFSIESLKPSSVLMRLNRLADDVLDTPFATLAYLVLDPEDGVCRLSSAGHPPPVLACPDGRVVLLESARGLPLGTGVHASYRQETIALPAGSVVVLYTDGLVERRGHSIDDGLRALQDAVAQAPKDPDKLLEHILEHVVGSGERDDDTALLAARFLPVAPRPLELRLAPHFDSMDVVRDAMRTWLEGVDIDRVETEDVVLATWEACANAIEHAVEPTGSVVVVRADLFDSRVRVRIENTGGWAPSSAREDRGLGLRLIEALMSSVDVSKGATGTVLTLEKTIAAKPTEAD